MNFVKIFSIFFVVLVVSTGWAKEKDNTLESLGYKTAFDNIIEKNLAKNKSNSFAVRFYENKVTFYQVTDCSVDFVELDSIDYTSKTAALDDRFPSKYSIFIDFSLKDKQMVSLDDLREYYLCFMTKNEKTIFVYTGDENTRGGGPMYVFDKNNNLLEVHYMQ